MKKVIVYVVGKPGSGKGTISQYLVKELHAKHIIASKILYKYLSENYNDQEMNQVKLAKEIKYYPELDTLMIKEMIDANKKTNIIVLDGYPRLIKQLNAHLSLLKNTDEFCDHYKVMILLTIDDDLAIKRIGNRLNCNSCKLVFTSLENSHCTSCNRELTKRIDDNSQVFSNRIITFTKTQEVIDEMKNHVDKILLIDVRDELQYNLSKILNNFKLYQ
jgi:adenylate kinase